jgi:uncharacterized protein (TIGR02452 family)
MSLVDIAQATLQIVNAGTYQAPSGRTVSIRDALVRAREGTRLYCPEDFPLVAAADASTQPRCEVTAETTTAAARRLTQQDGVTDVVVLNFASARNPGGGFLTGAKAQEEDLARCSALYDCLLTQPRYYEANRATRSLLYTDHLTYSPAVPFFRDDQLTLLEAPFLASVVTAPAPNAGRLEKAPDDQLRLKDVLRARARKVLEVAAKHGHRTLVLGAWGCGVFRNDPAEVAVAFEQGLRQSSGTFDRIVFAVYERSATEPNRRAFRDRFGG